MNESTGINGEIRVLDELVCTAICHDVPNSPLLGSGENAGFRMAATPKRSRFLPGDIRQLTPAQISNLVRMSGSDLTKEDRQLFTGILIEQLNSLVEGLKSLEIDRNQMVSTPSSK